MDLIEILLPADGAHGRLPSDPERAATMVVNALLADEPLAGTALSEATVHQSRRSHVWTATFTGPAGGQIWRSTGMTDREQALELAKRWEAEARAQRASLGRSLRKPALRARRQEPGTPWKGPLTQKEVAMLLNMSERGVRQVERRAFQKLRKHPMLRRVWQQYLAGEMDEHQFVLDQEEIEALFHAAQRPEEWQLLQKVLQLIQRR